MRTQAPNGPLVTPGTIFIGLLYFPQSFSTPLSELLLKGIFAVFPTSWNALLFPNLFFYDPGQMSPPLPEVVSNFLSQALLSLLFISKVLSFGSHGGELLWAGS